MSHRNKGKGSASTRAAQPVKTQVRSTPLPKAAPPPPKQTPSQRLRQEWKTFEVWYIARREEKDKRVSDRMNEIMAPKGRSKFHKPAPPSGSMDIKIFEAEQNQELATQARAEWLKRLKTVGLNEEDWTDLTVQEMEAIEAAFVVPEPSEINTSSRTPNDMMGSGMHSQTIPSALDKVEPWLSSVPGAWETAHPTTRNAASTRSPPTPSVPERTTYTPIISDRGTRTASSGLPTPELLWEMNMANKSGFSPPSSSSTTKPGPYDMRRSGSRAQTGSLASSLSSPTTPSTNESLWNMYANTSASSIPQGYASEASMKETRKSKTSLAEQLSTPPPDSPWATYEASRSKPAPAAQRTNSVAADNSDSLWNSYISGPPVEDPIPSPALTETPEEPPSPSYVYLSPVLVELEEEDPANLELLPEKTAETSIREFHQMAAEADIELRRKLLKGKVEPQEYDQLLEDHLNNMEKYCREVVEKWKKDREAENQRRIAEEKKRLAELEKKKLAEAKKQPIGGKWGAAAKNVAARVKSPEPQPKKGPLKGNNAQKARKVTVEEVPDVDEPETSSLLGSMKADPEPRPEETPVSVRPAKNPQSNFLARGARAMGSRTSSPVPGKRPSEEQKKAPAASKNPFASQASNSTDPSPSPWESQVWGLNGGQGRSQGREREQEQEHSLWEANIQQERSLWEAQAQQEDESPSLWDTVGAATHGVWNLAANAFGGERSATPSVAAEPRMAYNRSNSDNVAKAWIDEDAINRSMSRGPVVEAQSNAAGKAPRYQMWTPNMNGPGGAADKGKDKAEEAASAVRRMAELAMQNLHDATENESSLGDTAEATTYTKTAASSNVAASSNTAASSSRKRAQGQGRRR